MVGLMAETVVARWAERKAGYSADETAVPKAEMSVETTAATTDVSTGQRLAATKVVLQAGHLVGLKAETVVARWVAEKAVSKAG